LLLGYWHLSVLLDFLGFRIGGRRHPPPFICSDSYKLYPLLGFLVLFWAALGTLCSVQSWPLVRPEDSILQFSFEFLVSLLLGDMDERIPPPPFFQYSPSGVHSSPHHHNSMRYSSWDRERYVQCLLFLVFCIPSDISARFWFSCSRRSLLLNHSNASFSYCRARYARA
jgi:hypothetical protein